MERTNLGSEDIKTVHVLLAILLDENNIAHQPLNNYKLIMKLYLMNMKVII